MWKPNVVYSKNPLVVQLFAELLQHGQLAFKFVDDFFHHPLNFCLQGLVVVAVAVQHAGLGQIIQQAPRGVVVVAEHGFVLQGDFQIRRVQVREQGFEVVGQVVIIEDVVKQHAD